MNVAKYKPAILWTLVLAFLFYSFYLYASVAKSEIQKDTAVVRGKTVWQQYNCNSCHQIYGLGGYLGPDLTNVYAKRSKEYIEAFLQSGTTIMPRFNLSKSEMNALMAFFEDVNHSGISDPRTFIINKDGTIRQNPK